MADVSSTFPPVASIEVRVCARGPRPDSGAVERAKDANFGEDLPGFGNREVSAMTNEGALFPIETSVRSHERI